MKRIVASVLLVNILTSCAVAAPEISKDQSYGKECELKTKNLDLKVGVIPIEPVGENCDEKCLIFPAILSASTFVVSGSIVLVNDTLHWLEYEGKCKLGLGKYLTNSEGKEVEVMTESCVLECKLETGQCECIGKSKVGT